MAGVKRPRDEADQHDIERLTRLARHLRPPLEAHPDLAAIRVAGLPVLSVSGEHNPAIERICT